MRGREAAVTLHDLACILGAGLFAVSLGGITKVASWAYALRRAPTEPESRAIMARRIVRQFAEGMGGCDGRKDEKDRQARL